MMRDDLPVDDARLALRLIPRIHRWATARVLDHHLSRDVSLRQLTVLYRLRDGTRSPGDLARQLMVTPAVVTGMVDRLERRGYVRRETDPDDGRRLRLTLTEAGEAASLAVEQALAEEMAIPLAEYSTEELAALGRSLTLLERVLGALETGGLVDGAVESARIGSGRGVERG
jgi:DNA-binding MarR family transcriptional regulator